MPFKVLNSRTVIIAGERVLSQENSNYHSLNYFYLLLLNKAWKDIPKNKVEKIYELLDISANGSLRFPKDVIFLSPRNGSQSPWSSKTEDIFTSCNLNEVQRIERIKGLETEDFAEKLLKKENFPFDYLTEEFSVGLKSIESFFTKPNKNSFSFKYLKNSYQSYIDANQKFGFGLNDQEINYLVNSYKSLKRNPTDVELMMFSQANSEHCRHKFFNASWQNLSKENEPSLFQQIKSTHKNFNDGVLVAYDDNAAVIESESSEKFHLDTDKREYQTKNLKHNICIKVETHNHPTAVSPFEGAATGSGGEIRDEGATGIGAQPKAGLTGYSVSYLRLESLKEKWEFKEDRPKRISSPKKIMIEGPLGSFI